MNFDILYGMVFIMVSRLADVSLGTIRTLMVVKGHKYQAAIIGIAEVTIWLIAIRFIMQNLDNFWNIAGYSAGFAGGTMLGITIEERFGKGFIQMYVVSAHFADKIADKLRDSKIGVTILPGEGRRGGIAILVIILQAKRKKEAIQIVEALDPKAFISIHSAISYRGYFHNRK